MSEKLILVGNPNVGKSVIFSNLTRSYVVVSNYPGTTVEISRGQIRGAKFRGEVIDTPGVHSLLPKSEDELVTLKVLLNGKEDSSVVQVINSLNLKRGLFLTAQLMLMGVPLIIDLNVLDEAKSRGIDIDSKKLEDLMGVSVIKTVATRRAGLKRMRSVINEASSGKWSISFAGPIEDAIKSVSDLLPETCPKRFISLLLLANGELAVLPHSAVDCVSSLDKKVLSKIESIGENLNDYYGEALAYQINQQIHDAVERIYAQVVIRVPVAENTFLRKLGDLMMHPLWGFIFVVVILYLIYLTVGVFGAGDVVDFMEGTVFGEWLTPVVENAVGLVETDGFFHSLIVGEYGLWSIGITYAAAIVLPIVGLFFLLFGVLEDSGYLPRLAVMLNKPFRLMGLSGKAVLPMILGLGCGSMATLTTRILESRKEKILVTLLLALAIPCSAQLGVILGMLGVISFSALLWWFGSIIIVLLVVGRIAAKIIPGEKGLFVQEIPPLRVPQLKNLVVKTLARIEWYLKEAVPLFLLGTFVLFLLDFLGLIPAIERAAEPVISGLMGLPKESASVLIMGFLRRDYAATGFFDLARDGLLTPVQTLVSLVVITLFVPCIAQFLIILKERGWKVTSGMILFIVPFSILFAAFLNLVLGILGITFT